MASRAEAKYIITAEDRSSSTLSKVGRSIRNVAGQVARVGGAALAAGIAGFAVMAREALQSADRVAKLNAATGASTELLSELRGIASLSGSDFESLAKAIGTMQKQLGAAKLGGKAQIEALQVLGLSLRSLKGLNVDQTFELIGSRLAKVKDESLRAKAGADLLGRGYRDVIQVFENGVGSFREMREEQRKLGRSMSSEQVAAAEAANDAWDRLQQTIQGFVETLTLEFAGDLADFVGNLKDVIVPTIKAVAAGIGVVGRAIGGALATGHLLLQGDFAGALAASSLATSDVLGGGGSKGGGGGDGEAVDLLREMAANTSRMANAVAGR